MIIDIIEDIIKQRLWAKFFDNFSFPYGFCSPDEYRDWLTRLGFRSIRAELITKDMIHEDGDKLAAWIRTTWIPYTQRVPESQREEFIRAIVEEFIRKHPADSKGRIHLQMKRLEIQAGL
jgi:trans-aconitate methyltransferase